MRRCRRAPAATEGRASASRTRSWTNASRAVSGSSSQQVRAQGLVDRVQHRLVRLARAGAAAAPRRRRIRRRRRARAAVGSRSGSRPPRARRRPRARSGQRRHVRRVLRQFPHEERVAVRFARAARATAARVRPRPRHLLDDGGDGRGVEPVQGDPDDRPVAPDLGESSPSPGGAAPTSVSRALPTRSSATALRARREAAQQEQRRPTRPSEGRRARARAAESAASSSSHSATASNWRARSPAGSASGAPGRPPRAAPRPAASVSQSVKRLERLDERLVRDGRLLLAAAVQHERAAPVDRARELGEQARLADTRLAGDERHAALASPGAARAPREAGRIAASRPGKAPCPRPQQAPRERQAVRVHVEPLASKPRRELARRRRGGDAQLPRQPPGEGGVRAQRGRAISRLTASASISSRCAVSSSGSHAARRRAQASAAPASPACLAARTSATAASARSAAWRERRSSTHSPSSPSSTSPRQSDSASSGRPTRDELGERAQVDPQAVAAELDRLARRPQMDGRRRRAPRADR